MNNQLEKNNQVTLKGIIDGEITYSHSVMGEGFYEFTLASERLSGEIDMLPITISERLLSEINTGKEIALTGQLRSYNKQENEKSKLILTIFAREILNPSQIYIGNQICVTGFICKTPIYRTTPFGREISDLLIAVNRSYGKSDYLPCIAWGRNARFAKELTVGDKVELVGRIQSRKYQKKYDDNTVSTKTAYEVSISSIMAVSYQKEENKSVDNQVETTKTLTEIEDELFSDESAAEISSR